MPELQEFLQKGLGSDYTVERELGGGGMSRVAVAYDNRLGRRVVVKILPPDLAATVSVDRFRREILLVAKLQHPHVVPILSAGELEGLPYLIMPFVEGESLRVRLTRGPLGVLETVRILRDVSRALAYAHERGVVHRDIKPDNVLLSGGSALVADFGVAKALSSARRQGTLGDATITMAGTSLGTPAYMAPEQIAADPAVDHRADLYALGIMAYEMLAGTPPFHGRARQALMAAHLTEAPAPLGEQRQGIPTPLCELIMRCLEKDPEKRPQSAGEIVAALDDPAVISGAFSTPVALPTPAPAARRRSRLALGALAAAIVVLLAVGGWLGVRRAGGGAAVRPSGAAAAPARPAVAVLPLVYIGTDSSRAYIADGIATAISGALARVSGVRIASRAASIALQRRIALGQSVDSTVNTLFEGVVQQEGQSFRVATRLVDARDGFTLWADAFEGDGTNVFALQDAIARASVDALRSHYGLDTLTAIPARP